MARLIDADALMKSIKSFRWFGVPNTLQLMFDYLKIIIRDQPTVDAVPVWIVHRKDSIYDIYKGNRDNWVIARLSADNIFAWLAEQNLVDIRFVDESIPNCGAEMDGDGNG